MTRARNIALLSLAMVTVVSLFVLRNHLEESRRELVSRKQFGGTITYGCSDRSDMVDFDHQSRGKVRLELTAKRSPSEAWEWLVKWPGKSPVEANNFEAETGSYGGSQGIQWNEANGSRVTAILSFSDIIEESGPSTVWVLLKSTDDRRIPDLKDPSYTHLTCRPDARSFRAD